MTRLLNDWVNENVIKYTAFKTLMIMTNLLQRKLSKSSKAEDHLNALERRLDLWNKVARVNCFMKPRPCRRNLWKQSSSSQDAQKYQTVSRLSRFKYQASSMHKGNVNAVIKLLASNMQNGSLPINNDTLDFLKQKPPRGKPAHEIILLTGTPEPIHPAKFESMSAESTWRGALRAYVCRKHLELLKQRENQYHKLWMLMGGEKWCYQKVLVSHQMIFVLH